MVAFPPEPWRLVGQLHASVFLVPAADVPLDLPAGCHAVRIGDRLLVGTAWVDYEPAGELSYCEVMATVLVRRGLRLLPTIVAIWVDSEASRDGGRALWGIPKDLAHFEFRGDSFHAGDDHTGIASGTVRSRLRLPGRWPVRFSVVQRLEGATKISPVRTRAGVELASATFEPDPTGPLGFLAGHRPWLTVTLRDFAMSFGRAAPDAAQLTG